MRFMRPKVPCLAPVDSGAETLAMEVLRSRDRCERHVRNCLPRGAEGYVQIMHLARDLVVHEAMHEDVN